MVHTYFNATGQLIGVGYTSLGFSATMGMYIFTGAGININDEVLFYAPLHLDRGVTDTLYFGTNKLYRANTFWATPVFSVMAGGQNLALSSPGSGNALSAIETVANTTPGQNADIIFTGANNGVVFRSTNGGTSFTQVDVGGSALYVSDILVDPNDNDIVYQSRSGFSGAAGLNVRKSTDGGGTWFASGTGIPDIPVNAIAIDPVVSDRIWAGTDTGAFVSTDAGANWTPHNLGMANVAIFDLKANGVTENLVAFTHGRSAYLLDIGDPCMDGETWGLWNLPVGNIDGVFEGGLYINNLGIYKMTGTLSESSPGQGRMKGIIYDALAPTPDYDVAGSWTITTPPGTGTFAARVLLPGTNIAVGTVTGRFRDNPAINIRGRFRGDWEICD